MKCEFEVMYPEESCEPAVEGETHCQECIDFNKAMFKAVDNAYINDDGCLCLDLPDSVLSKE